eukprot:343352-Rhodomonas_salina.1
MVPAVLKQSEPRSHCRSQTAMVPVVLSSAHLAAHSLPWTVTVSCQCLSLFFRTRNSIWQRQTSRQSRTSHSNYGARKAGCCLLTSHRNPGPARPSSIPLSVLNGKSDAGQCPGSSAIVV